MSAGAISRFQTGAPSQPSTPGGCADECTSAMFEMSLRLLQLGLLSLNIK